nr:hypothetical protein [Bradyrhizobium sp. SEMIA]
MMLFAVSNNSSNKQSAGYARTIRHAEQRVFARERHEVQAAVVQLLECDAETGADRFQPEVQFRLVVFGVEIDCRSGLGNEPNQGASAWAQHNCKVRIDFPTPPSQESNVTARRMMRSRTAQSRCGTSASSQPEMSSGVRGLCPDGSDGGADVRPDFVRRICWRAILSHSTGDRELPETRNARASKPAALRPPKL